MDVPRFHLDAPLTTGLHVELSQAEAHHAVHVLRLRAGDAIELFNGRGEVAAGRIVLAKHGWASCEVGAVEAAKSRPGPGIHVAFAVPKGKRLDWLLEKATELAAASLTPVAFERSVAGGEDLEGAKRERWLGHCIAAAKQSGLNFLPELRESQTLTTLLAVTTADADAGTLRRLAGDLTDDSVPLTDALAGAPADASAGPAADILLIVGPEGGFSDAERRQLAAARVTPVRLGQTILRIETAAIALLAAATALAGAR